MTLLKLLFFIFYTGGILTNVMSFNPLLTYITRFKKIVLYPNITGNYTIDQHMDRQYYINGHFTIYSDKAEQIDKVIVVFERCNPEGNDCEYFQSWTLTDICNKLKENNQIWSRWYASFYPPMVCPINNGNYEIRNGTLDIAEAIRWYPDVTNYHWKVKQLFHAVDVYVGAYKIETSIFGYRKKLKSILRF